MDWITENLHAILAGLLFFSEGTALVAQLIFPENKGVNGILAMIVKLMQGMSDGTKPKQ